ncbi:SWIB/MDM2 domain-containing protein [Trametes meyenii]|nr:SWIB/MDM2 domain-containing protein [Trametes meyenii]
MAFDAASLEPKIRAILTAPGTDLATISAKRVRKELLDQDPSLPAEVVKEKKAEIDAIIAEVYEEVSGARNPSADANDSDLGGKRKRAHDASEGEDEPPAPKTKKSKQKQGLTDEEVARRLSDEINGPARTSRAASSKTKADGAKRGGKKGPKSSAVVASDAEEGESGEEAKPKKRGGGFKKEYTLSEPLAVLLGVEKLSRPQIVKQLWTHIKANNMQNPENKKEIICDDQFKVIFKCDRIDMFKMNKELNHHLHDPQTSS